MRTKINGRIMTLITLFLLSLGYRILYITVLHDIVRRTFDITYRVILTLGVNPIFYFTMAALLTTLVYRYAIKPITKRWRKGLTIASLVIFAGCMITILLSNSEIVTFMFLHPKIHIIPGILFALGTAKSKSNDAPREAAPTE